MKTYEITLINNTTFPIIANDEEDAKNILADLLVDRELYRLYDLPEELVCRDIDTFYGAKGIHPRIIDIQQVDFPKGFIVDDEAFRFGALLSNGDIYYLSEYGNVVRANDFSWCAEEIDNDGNIVLEEFAVNGLFFDDDLSLLTDVGIEIITNEMKEFIK